MLVVTRALKRSLVSVSPVINFKLFGYFWPVSTTPWKNVIESVNNTADKLFAGVNGTAHHDKLWWRQMSVLSANRWYLRPQKSDTAADGVIGPAMKSCIPHILIRGPWGLQNCFKPNRRYLVWRPRVPLIKMCGVPMDATFHGGSNDTISGRVWLPRPEISPICPLQRSPILGSSPPPWRSCSCHWQLMNKLINYRCRCHRR